MTDDEAVALLDKIQALHLRLGDDDKLRAEWFWTDRWRNSSAYLLPAEARGVYREMLTTAWTQRARLPTGHDTIRRATATSPEEWARAWPMVSRYWRTVSVGGAEWLVNDTQLEVYVTALERAVVAKERSSAGGKARAQAYAKAPARADAQAPTQAQPKLRKTPRKTLLKQCPPSPSPSKSTEQTNDLRKREGLLDAGPPAGPGDDDQPASLAADVLDEVTDVFDRSADNGNGPDDLHPLPPGTQSTGTAVGQPVSTPTPATAPGTSRPEPHQPPRPPQAPSTSPGQSRGAVRPTPTRQDLRALALPRTPGPRAPSPGLQPALGSHVPVSPTPPAGASSPKNGTPGDPKARAALMASLASMLPGGIGAPDALQAAVAREIRHDPSNPLHVELLALCTQHARTIADADRRPVNACDVVDVFVAVTSLDSGKHLEALIGAPDSWVTTSIGVARSFEP